MQLINIIPSNYSPHVVLNPSGLLSLKGRSMMLDAEAFYRPLIEWASQIETSSVTFTIELDFFNTSSSKKLLELLKTLDNNPHIQVLIINWGYEPDDEEILEKGFIFEKKLKKGKFRFTELFSIET